MPPEVEQSSDKRIETRTIYAKDFEAECHLVTRDGEERLEAISYTPTRTFLPITSPSQENSFYRIQISGFSPDLSRQLYTALRNPSWGPEKWMRITRALIRRSGSRVKYEQKKEPNFRCRYNSGRNSNISQTDYLHPPSLVHFMCGLDREHLEIKRTEQGERKENCTVLQISHTRLPKNIADTQITIRDICGGQEMITRFYIQPVVMNPDLHSRIEDAVYQLIQIFKSGNRNQLKKHLEQNLGIYGEGQLHFTEKGEEHSEESIEIPQDVRNLLKRLHERHRLWKNKGVLEATSANASVRGEFIQLVGPPTTVRQEPAATISGLIPTKKSMTRLYPEEGEAAGRVELFHLPKKSDLVFRFSARQSPENTTPVLELSSKRMIPRDDHICKAIIKKLYRHSGAIQRKALLRLVNKAKNFTNNNALEENALFLPNGCRKVLGEIVQVLDQKHGVRFRGCPSVFSTAHSIQLLSEILQGASIVTIEFQKTKFRNEGFEVTFIERKGQLGVLLNTGKENATMPFIVLFENAQRDIQRLLGRNFSSASEFVNYLLEIAAINHVSLVNSRGLQLDITPETYLEGKLYCDVKKFAGRKFLPWRREFTTPFPQDFPLFLQNLCSGFECAEVPSFTERLKHSEKAALQYNVAQRVQEALKAIDTPHQ